VYHWNSEQKIRSLNKRLYTKSNTTIMTKKFSILFTFFFILCIGMQAQEVSRVEPPFWWAGMKNPALQLLVYGENISEYNKVSANYEHIMVNEVHKVESPNYLFVDLELGGDLSDGKYIIEFENAKGERIDVEYEIKSREAGSANREGFTTADVMYLITPDRFVNGKPGNDEVEGMPDPLARDEMYGRHGGDIAGIYNSLDYFEEMGFTAIWLNPIIENNQPASSYHGYAATDFYKVDARFGSNEEYAKLAYDAKQRGIKLIMDMIFNHCGSHHWWMYDPPTSDWFNYPISMDTIKEVYRIREETGELKLPSNYVGTNHRKYTIQDPYVSQKDLVEYTDGWFWLGMPDLNGRNKFMATYLIQNSIWWVEYAHLAGIRMDTYSYPDEYFMSDWTCELLKEYPNLNIVGEEWIGNPAIVSYWQGGKKNPNGYASCLPSLMDFPLQEAVVKALKNDKNAWGGQLAPMYEMLASDFLYPDAANLVVFPDNHDMSRFYTQLDEDYELFKMGIAYFLTTRGIPQIYYGTEILMSNKGSDQHGVIRSDFPGGWEGDSINGFTGEGLSEMAIEAQEYFKKLLNWRKNNEIIHNGKLMHFAPHFNVYALVRYTSEGAVMLLMNVNEEETSINSDRYEEIIGGYTNGTDVISGVKQEISKAITIPAKSALILELE
jgi:glycosidase